MKPFGVVLAAGLAVATTVGAEPVELRGAWVWGRSCATPEAADAMLARAEAMHLNALYVLTFYYAGTATHRSELVPLNSAVADGFDPLGYLCEQGRRKGLEIHAWFVNGSCSGEPAAPWFQAHPDWRARTMRGDPTPWFDLLQPDVRQFQADLMLEVARRYDVASVHFDYIRFNGHNVRSTPAVEAGVKAELGFAVDELTSEAFPLVEHLQANPLDQPTTATVLARFGDGVPAIAENRLGAGRVVLFNYRLDASSALAANTVLTRALQRLGAPAGGEVLVLDGAATAAKYGRARIVETVSWLKALGYRPRVIGDADIAALPAGAVVVCMTQFQMPGEQAAALVRHVRAGGGCVFIDGPVFAMGAPAAQELLGFRTTGRYFSADQSIVPVAGVETFLPLREGGAGDAAGLPAKLQAWTAWRRDQVTKLVADVSRRCRAESPGKMVTAAVFYTREGSDAVLQDWPRWVREGLLDYAIPMSYVPSPEALRASFAWWRTIDPDLNRIIPSISVKEAGTGHPPDALAEQIGRQILVCREERARGFAIFSLEGITDATARRLGETVLADQAVAYRPAAR